MEIVGPRELSGGRGVKGRAHTEAPPPGQASVTKHQGGEGVKLAAAGRVGPGAVHSADIRSHPKGHHQRRGHGHLPLLLPAIGPRRVQAAQGPHSAQKI